jgi:hypothetical protein
MASSGMLHCVALVRTDISEELSASTMRVTRIDEPGTTLAITSNHAECLRNVGSYKATRRNIPEDAFFLFRQINFDNFQVSQCVNEC